MNRIQRIASRLEYNTRLQFYSLLNNLRDHFYNVGFQDAKNGRDHNPHKLIFVEHSMTKKREWSPAEKARIFSLADFNTPAGELALRYITEFPNTSVKSLRAQFYRAIKEKRNELHQPRS